MIVADKHSDNVMDQVRLAIFNKLIIEFRYTDRTGKEETRIVEPYLLGIDKKGQSFLSGYFKATEEQLRNGKKSGHKNFLFDSITETSLKVSSKTFGSLKVESPDKIYKTTETIVLAAVYFPEIIRAKYFPKSF